MPSCPVSDAGMSAPCGQSTRMREGASCILR